MSVLLVTLVVAVVMLTCASNGGRQQDMTPEAQREQMVDNQIRRRGITNARVLDAMRRVPRHEFVPEPYRHQAYLDQALTIGHGQTISQPFVVAYMSDVLDPQPGHRVLEIGTGSGYQAAILAELAGEVFSIEIVDELASEARETLARLGYTNVQVRLGDGYKGWPEAAPFDRIIVTAAPPELPQALIDQLAVDGVLVAPVGPAGDVQTMTVVRKSVEGTTSEQTIAVQFVPMVSE